MRCIGQQVDIFVPEIAVLEADKMGKGKDLSDF